MRKFRLECDGHWWNFDSRDVAEEAAKALVQECASYSITEVYVSDDEQSLIAEELINKLEPSQSEQRE